MAYRWGKVFFKTVALGKSITLHPMFHLTHRSICKDVRVHGLLNFLKGHEVLVIGIDPGDFKGGSWGQYDQNT